MTSILKSKDRESHKSTEQLRWEREQEYERRYHESSWDLDEEQEHKGPSKTDSTAG